MVKKSKAIISIIKCRTEQSEWTRKKKMKTKQNVKKKKIRRKLYKEKKNHDQGKKSNEINKDRNNGLQIEMKNETIYKIQS